MNLENIANKAADDLKAFIAEAKDEIEQAAIQACESAADNETAARLVLSLAIRLDLDNGHQENVLTFGVRHKLSAKSEMEDPAQLKLAALANN